MNSRNIKVANYVSWGHHNNGFLANCRYCGRTIYMHCDWRGWRPFPSWEAGDVAPGQWELHRCSSS